MHAYLKTHKSTYKCAEHSCSNLFKQLRGWSPSHDEGSFICQILRPKILKPLDESLHRDAPWISWSLKLGRENGELGQYDPSIRVGQHSNKHWIGHLSHVHQGYRIFTHNHLERITNEKYWEIETFCLALLIHSNCK